MGFPNGIARIGQVMTDQLDVRILDHPLKDLAVRLEEGDPAWFGVQQPQADRPLEDVTFDRAVDSCEQAQLPLRTGVTRFLRKPYV